MDVFILSEFANIGFNKYKIKWKNIFRRMVPAPSLENYYELLNDQKAFLITTFSKNFDVDDKLITCQWWFIHNWSNNYKRILLLLVAYA